MTGPPLPAGPEDLRGASLFAAVAEHGAVVVPLLDPDEVERLQQGYRSLTTEEGFGCRPSTISPDPVYRKAARDLVASVLEPKVQVLLPGYQCVVAAFVPKEPGPGSEMAVHQDWSTCDEDRWLPLEVWVPLTPAADEDGGLHVALGSHRRAPRYRGSGSPMVDQTGAVAELRPASVPPGHALIFHPAIAHGSGPNRGSEMRLAVISTFQPTAAEVLHYRVRPDGDLDVYRVAEDFYVSNHPMHRPVPGERVGVVQNRQFQ